MYTTAKEIVLNNNNFVILLPPPVNRQNNMINDNDAVPSKFYHFHWLDFAVFGTMLVLSGLSGIYFGFYRKKQVEAPSDDSFAEKGNDFGSKSMNEYLLGSRKMKSFPVAMSLVAR